MILPFSSLPRRQPGAQEHAASCPRWEGQPWLCAVGQVISLPTHLLCTASHTQHISRADSQGQRPSRFSEMPVGDQGSLLFGQLKPAHTVSPPVPGLKPSRVPLLPPALLSSALLHPFQTQALDRSAVKSHVQPSRIQGGCSHSANLLSVRFCRCIRWPGRRLTGIRREMGAQLGPSTASVSSQQLGMPHSLQTASLHLPLQVHADSGPMCLSTWASSALGGLFGSQVVVGLHAGFLGQ